MEKLEALGFTFVVGNIDRDGVNYGVMTANGPVLTPEGEALVAELSAPKRKKKASAEEIAAVIAEVTPDTPAE